MASNGQTAGIVSVVSGVLAIASTILPLVGVLAVPIAVTTGIIALRSDHKKLGWTGLGLGILATLLWVGIITIAFIAGRQPND